MKALLIIDMQKASFTKEAMRYDTEGIVTRINSLASYFRKNSLPVMVIQHDGTGSGICEKGAKEWELLDSLEVKETDIYVDKTANDVFYNSELLNILQSQKINEVIITGDATDFCVAASMQSALAKDFEVTVISDGHSTGDRPHAKAQLL